MAASPGVPFRSSPPLDSKDDLALYLLSFQLAPYHGCRE